MQIQIRYKYKYTRALSYRLVTKTNTQFFQLQVKKNNKFHTLALQYQFIQVFSSIYPSTLGGEKQYQSIYSSTSGEDNNMSQFIQLQVGTPKLRSKGQHLSQISKIINFHPIDFKFEEDLHIRSGNSTTNYFGGHQGEIPKIVNFHSIDLKFEDNYLHIRSLNSTTNYFFGQISWRGFHKYHTLHDVFLVCLFVCEHI